MTFGKIDNNNNNNNDIYNANVYILKYINKVYAGFLFNKTFLHVSILHALAISNALE